ncbi:MAG: MlaD family protein [Candidatus Auribacterota bacterium]
MAQFFRKEILPGLFVIVSAVLLIAFIFAINPQGFRKDAKQIEVIFDCIAGLRENAAVWFSGVETYQGLDVGRVTRIQIIEGDTPGSNEYKISVLMEINAAIPLKEGSQFRIASKGLAGYPHVEIIPGPPTAPDMNLSQPHKGNRPPDDMFTTLQKLAVTVDEMDLPTLSAATQDTIKTIGDVAKEINVAAADMREVIHEIKEKEQIQGIVSNIHALSAKSVDTVDDARKTIKDAQVFVATMQSSADKIDTILSDNQENINVMLANLRETSETLNVRMESTMNKLDDLLARIDIFFKENKEELNAILVNLRATTQNARLFTQDIKLNPWKLFFRKKEQIPENILKPVPDKGPVIE